jgi:hypothetical protein
MSNPAVAALAKISRLQAWVIVVSQNAEKPIGQ